LLVARSRLDQRVVSAEYSRRLVAELPLDRAAMGNLEDDVRLADRASVPV
jgi:hypothetical protein